MALLANSQAVSMVEAQRQVKARSQAQMEAELIEMANQLERQEIILKAKTGAKEKLYGSITSTDIAAEVQNSTGLVIDKRKIELAEPIRELGSYEVAIRLAKDIVPKIKVTVTEKEPE